MDAMKQCDMTQIAQAQTFRLLVEPPVLNHLPPLLESTVSETVNLARKPRHPDRNVEVETVAAGRLPVMNGVPDQRSPDGRLLNVRRKGQDSSPKWQER